MNKLQLMLLAVSLLIVASCKKTPEPKQDEEIRTPLHEVMDSKYLINGSYFLVDYKAYKPNFDLDKVVLKAAQATINGNFGFQKVIVEGTTITSTFSKYSNTSPDFYKLTPSSEAYKESQKKRKWRGRLAVVNENNLISKETFEQGVVIKLEVGNIGDKIKIVERIVSKSSIILIFEMESSVNGYEKISFNAQSNIAVRYMINYEVQFSFDNSLKYTSVNYPKDYAVQPKLEDIGSNTKRFSGSLDNLGAQDALAEYLADFYWKRDVVPSLK